MTYLQALLQAQTPEALPDSLPDGTRVVQLGEGLLAFEPVQPLDGQDAVISCGIHGNETAPVELVAKLVDELLAGTILARTRLLFIFGNPGAMRTGARYIEDDLNRLFGKPAAVRGEGPAAQRAAALELACSRFFAASGTRRKLHYDLHTAIRGSTIEKFAIYPYPHEQAFDDAEIARLGACGISAVLLQSKPSPTFSYFTRQHCGAAGFTLELGKARPFGENAAVNLDKLETQLRRVIAADTTIAAQDGDSVQRFQVSREIIKQTESFVLHLADDVENFTLLEPGFLLAEDGEQQIVVHEQGARIVFPNPKVKPGLRAGIIVVPPSRQDTSGCR